MPELELMRTELIQACASFDEALLHLKNGNHDLLYKCLISARNKTSKWNSQDDNASRVIETTFSFDFKNISTMQQL